jgi:peptidoglycan/LPS O-acetylase OafA/YrhL
MSALVRPQLFSIQYLRGLAALSVLVTHESELFTMGSEGNAILKTP